METQFTQDSIDRFRRYLLAIGSSPNTVRAYMTDLRLLHMTTGDLNLASQEAELAIAEYLTKLRTEAAPSTVNRKIAAIRKLSKWCGLPGFLGEYIAPQNPPQVPHPVIGGVDAVLQMIDNSKQAHHKALLALCGLCGLRLHEALKITCNDIVAANGDLQIQVLGKGGKWRNVDISDLAWPSILEAFVEAGKSADKRLVPLTDRAARRVITRRGNQIGLRVASHDLRSTFASEAWEASGHDTLAVQRQMGHARFDTTAGYTEVSPDRMRAAVEFKPRREAS